MHQFPDQPGELAHIVQRLKDNALLCRSLSAKCLMALGSTTMLLA